MDELGMERLLDHYQDPRNYGHLDDPDIVYEEGNPSCGDQLRFELKLADNRISEVRFSGKGCAISQASASMLTERIKGQTLEEVKTIDKDEVLEMLGLEISPMRLKCALLPLKIVKAGVYGIKGWPGEDED